jgi:hypothetical protein
MLPHRRTFLRASAVGLAGLAGLPSSAAVTPPGKARSVILFWLSGGASHVDTFDMKPDAPAEYRGEFRPIATSAPGMTICEHMPLIARQAHHLAIVRSLGHFGRGTGDHHAGYYYNLTGREPDPTFRQLLNNRKPMPSDWPFIGSVVASKKPAHPYLPSLLTLPQKPGAPEYTRPGQFAAKLGLQYDPVYIVGSREKPTEFSTPALGLSGDLTGERLLDRRALLDHLDAAQRSFEQSPEGNYSLQQRKAFTLLGSARVREVFDLTREPETVRRRYGVTVNGMSLLLARRLVEAAVPFVSVFWHEDPKLNDICKSGGGWDTHGSNFRCLREFLLPEFDRGFSALLDDLHQRGLLASTLVLVMSEMGRQPRIGDPRSGGPSGAGRDHWTEAQFALLAGGGVPGGQVVGSSDKVGAYPKDRPVTPSDLAATVYSTLGIQDLEATDRDGRPFALLPEGRPLF